MRALTSLLALSIAGCTAVFMDLVPGTSHEADVLARFGQPEFGGPPEVCVAQP